MDSEREKVRADTERASSNSFHFYFNRFAAFIKVGDFIFSTTSCSRGLCPERVIQVSFSTKKGKISIYQ